MDAKGLYKFYFEELKWCGCGNPEGAMEFMGKVLELLKLRSEENDPAQRVPYEQSAWAKRTAELKELLQARDEMLGLSYMYTLDAVGLLEHGGNIMGSWLDPKGHEVLAAIKAHGHEFDDEDAPWRYEDSTPVGTD